MDHTAQLHSFEVTEHGGINPESESPRFVAKHLSAYHFSRKVLRGSILELGFGDGYGSFFLAENAEQVKGIDLFQANVDAANKKYQRSNLEFLKMSATDLSFGDQTFDGVVSFQVIEHIPQPLLPAYIGEIKRVLKPGGKACLSTLNLKKNKKPGGVYEKSPHHDKEFMPEEFESFLKPFFQKVTLYGLYPTPKHSFYERSKKIGLFNFLPKSMNPVENYYRNIGVSDFEWLEKPNLDDCVDLMAVCHV